MQNESYDSTYDMLLVLLNLKWQLLHVNNFDTSNCNYFHDWCMGEYWEFGKDNKIESWVFYA